MLILWNLKIDQSLYLYYVVDFYDYDYDDDYDDLDDDDDDE